MSNDLTFFTVEGEYLDVESPTTNGTNTQSTVNTVSAFVTLFPRVPAGSVLYIDSFDLTQTSGGTGAASVALALPPIQCRVLSGVLQTIDRENEATIKLVANTSIISNALINQGLVASGNLFYDVQYTYVTYAEAPRQIANFGFLAPTTAGQTISLTDPNLPRYSYEGPAK
jgi:hypothetical protein